MRDEVFIGAGLLVAAYVMWQAGQGGAGVSEFTLVDATAGDENSNFFSDTADDMQSMITGWPAGSGPYQQIITDSANATGVPVSVLAWLLWKESRYRQDIINGTVRSSAGALGIAQFMPATARDELGSEAAALDPAQAIPGAARYLARLIGSAGSLAGGLAAYNWGIGNVLRKGLAAAPAETVDYYTTIMKKAGVA
ncbi:MAG: lytic transglycosylase domain-containing protein [Herbaspirillum sp.]|uniref:lytic transglycosylase domain-containing protein n=1 Tax=Herbaspirillum TaxID=963 RepID=UPI002584F0DA|nr:lytic transglycosylase domain-containing protein [Herbaspirillum sp.]MCP3653878.1 lytic transglycosylase domain-containing protein [Herbaspirillum sp.]MCP3947189.1 lytic transglycosylase domain-containing protein [Herbaspirillum sp.]MCP4032561.1 lytic transglycosylase domain-containing protein [Herbaspirillum sp.]MCP4555835.1 lytic transglycosylase domain-containing protein [Herbaspirillum sp.]